jgi:hypothetical protein
VVWFCGCGWVGWCHQASVAESGCAKQLRAEVIASRGVMLGIQHRDACPAAAQLLQTFVGAGLLVGAGRIRAAGSRLSIAYL